MSNLKTCSECQFFDPSNGFCRLNPPVPIVTTDKEGRKCITSVYPVIKRPDDDWCSYHEDLQ